MGAWGVSTFENDDAVDWLEEVLASDNLLILYSAFEMIDEEYLEAHDACNALAAAEVVAALNGAPRQSLPQQLRQWVENMGDEDTKELTTMALATVDKVTSQHSELNELWQESEEYDNWLADTQALKNALEN